MNKLAIIDTTSLLYYVVGHFMTESYPMGERLPKDIDKAYEGAVENEEKKYITIHPDRYNFNAYTNNFDERLKNLLDTVGTKSYIGFVDGRDNFRKRYLDSFKSDRLNKKPLQFLNELREYAQEKYGLIASEDLESDDMCLIAANHYKDEYDLVICSPDSDLRQYPGKFYDYRNGTFSSISEDDAAKNLLYMLLTKGHNNKVKSHLPDCGEKTANIYLETHGTYSGIIDAYIYGIHKSNFPTIYKSIKGLGMLGGIDTLHRSFMQTYLLRTVEECEYLGIQFNIPNVLTLKKNTEEKFIW